jgi:hypothetical protein
MALVKIKELESRVGTVIPSIQGRIVSVFPPKEGKGEHGAWKLQNISIEDDTGKCQVTLSGLPDSLTDLHKGKEIYLQSCGTKFGLKGVSVEKRDYTNKEGKEISAIGLKVTKTADIRFPGMEGYQEHPQEESRNEPEPVSSADTNKSLPRVNSLRNTANPAERLNQLKNLYEVCLHKAEEIEGLGDTREVASCLFIQAVREGLTVESKVEEAF